MTDDRMPTGGPLFNMTVGSGVLLTVGAVVTLGHVRKNIQAARIQLRQERADRKLERREKGPSRWLKMLNDWDEAVCEGNERLSADEP